ncbi:uncharacterized protein LOC113004434 isoform X2 [Solenopsis invicta]|uniref:uncharacterized protein LOC113004434 isoform X2 n=1 Tax=Solenopsis invicta TaxID=13686 RepID=UPI000E33E21A|nr:uncharacterized protein LOC113004434 isoform X2 [Solenopsis invicta]
MESKLLIDNKSCVLVEFSNEEEALAIGYKCWLNETVTEEELNNIIESKREVEIMWPKCDVHSARKMKNILKDWTSMSAELDLLQKNDVLCTTKQYRHLIIKRTFASTGKRDKSIKKEKIRKKDKRHLLLDLLNSLYTKEDFATCSRSG